MRSSRDLPSLLPLRAFEAAGRLLSFSRAAQELLITQSAVSHHIRNLEAELGLKLFVRRTRAVDLTPEGERYLAQVRQAFATLSEATRALKAGRARPSVRVSLLSSFATNWLVPRLPLFAAEHPDVELVLDPTLRVVDLAGGEADLAIRYGEGAWPGLDCRLLMAERLSPVCGPAYLAGAEPDLSEPAGVLAHPLLTTLRPFDWQAWLAAQGLDLASARTVMLTDYNIVLQAAVDGQGLAIGRTLLIADRLRAGALVQPFPERVVATAGIGHWLVTPRGQPLPDAARRFADWLTEQADAAQRR